MRFLWIPATTPHHCPPDHSVTAPGRAVSGRLGSTQACSRSYVCLFCLGEGGGRAGVPRRNRLLNNGNTDRRNTITFRNNPKYVTQSYN